MNISTEDQSDQLFPKSQYPFDHYNVYVGWYRGDKSVIGYGNISQKLMIKRIGELSKTPNAIVSNLCPILLGKNEISLFVRNKEIFKNINVSLTLNDTLVKIPSRIGQSQIVSVNRCENGIQYIVKYPDFSENRSVDYFTPNTIIKDSKVYKVDREELWQFYEEPRKFTR